MITQQLIERKQLVSVSSFSTVSKAAESMRIHSTGCVLVQDSIGNLTGILTDRDIVCRSFDSSGGFERPVAEIMTSHMVTVTPEDDLECVVHLMEENGVRRIPVVVKTDAQHLKAIGIISLDDLILQKLIDYDHLVRILRNQFHPREARLSG